MRSPHSNIRTSSNMSNISEENSSCSQSQSTSNTDQRRLRWSPKVPTGGINAGGRRNPQMPPTGAAHQGVAVGGGGAAPEGPNVGGDGSGKGGGAAGATIAGAKKFRRAVCYFFTLGLYGSGGTAQGRNRRAMANMAAIANSRVWRYLTIFCSFVLLFGLYIQLLLCPASWDIGFTVLFTITVVVLFVDIIFNCCLEPDYFLWHCRMCGSHKRNTCCYRNATAGDDDANNFPGVKESSCCHVGSFMFWLDLISLCCLLPSLDYIAPGFHAENVSIANLADNGMLGSSDGSLVMVEDVGRTLLSIGRTCRFARFISAYNAVRIAEWVNLYNLSQHVASCFAPDERRNVGGSGEGNGGRFCAMFRRLCCPRLAQQEIEVEAAVKIQRFWRRYKGGGAEYSGRPSRRSKGPKIAGSRPQASLKNGKKHRKGSEDGIRRSRSMTRHHHTESSQVGSAMRELTAQRVTAILIVALIFSILFSYREPDLTSYTTMIMLHSQTETDAYSAAALHAARSTAVPNLYEYDFSNGTSVNFPLSNGGDPSSLRESEKLNVTVVGPAGRVTSGTFDQHVPVRGNALFGLVTTFFMFFVWVVGVVCTAGPVMTLVVTPIERMTRLLSMLTKDPLGYQATPRYKVFMEEEYDVVKKTQWTKEVLKGMETSFLMSTILRIGSLMRVGFGTAGVEIIRNNLQKGSNSLVMNLTGSTVSCIFLFCDIRQFTDATEALQEEVFVFTNRIAYVVHSICSSYGGSANKNVGDAFLLSWRLDDLGPHDSTNSFNGIGSRGGSVGTSSVIGQLLSKNCQADRALLSVIKICIALYNDAYFLKEMSNFAKEKLKEKIGNRKGPAVQMGFGLHAGEAVQGAIGSQRKIDATYVSETVDRSETLESSTKRYGLKVLMSNAFHDLLSASNQRRCRKIDQLLLEPEGQLADDVDLLEAGEILELFTFDMDIDALYAGQGTRAGEAVRTNSGIDASRSRKMRRTSMLFPAVDRSVKGGKRPSRRSSNPLSSAAAAGAEALGGVGLQGTDKPPSNRSLMSDMDGGKKRFVFSLPTGPAAYNPSVWLNEEMRIIRKRYTDGLFYQTFNSGLQAYFNRDWNHAKTCFTSILERFEDGPSRYFLTIIDENNCHPPHGFTGYGSV